MKMNNNTNNSSNNNNNNGRGAYETFLVVVLIFFIGFRAAHANDDDELELLLTFKASIQDPLHALSNWNSSVPLCTWVGITCNNNSDSSSSHVAGIDISSKNVTGKLLPPVVNLPYLKTIDLSNNQFSGEIPDGIFSFSSNTLHYLNLSNNNFTGPIPRGTISRLETLDLSNNVLSGEIPADLGSFSGLKYLDLGGNMLIGSIPRSISNISSLEVFTLASNQLTGEIPREIGQIVSLKWIYLGYNNLTGEIPREIGELTSLNHLDLVYNNLTGEIPESLGNLSNLQYLFLYQNMISGPIPTSIFGLKKLISLDLSDNSLSGEISESVIQLQQLEILHLFGNKLTGKIPLSLALLPHLQVLQLWSNKLSGEIPQDLGTQSNLTVLDLSSNFLIGKVPESLCKSGNLVKLILFSNFLQGELPASLSRCMSLQRVRLQGNRLSGTLSHEFTRLPLVYYLDVSDNNLSGKVGNWNMPSLQLLNLAGNAFSGELPKSFGSDRLENLDLSENRLSGSIPSSFGDFSELMQLKLRGNELTGKIPEQLSLCMKLVSLDLSYNQLVGEIPSALSEMPVLGQLDLSENELSGEIPPNLGRITSLVEVNVSHNHLHGMLPSTGAFLAINSSAVVGNSLCGGRDDKNGLPPCKSKKSHTICFLAMWLLGALVVILLIASSVIFFLRRKNLELKRVKNEYGLWEIQFFDSESSKLIAIDDILWSRNKENDISRGKGEVSYKGACKTNGVEFVMKEFDSIDSPPPNFWTEIARLGKLNHRNIIRTIGTCRSKKCGLVLYEHVEGKRLNEILPSLSWERRKKVAMALAKALKYLHCFDVRGTLAGEVSPEKVIVDASNEPRLKLSLPSLVNKNTKCLMSSSYIAPEARETKDPTKMSDIYGFGLILITLLTGKTPEDNQFGMHKNIVEWARYCYSDCDLNTWIDPTVRTYARDHRNEIVDTMGIALHCTADDPKTRPCSREVSKVLDSVGKTTSRVSFPLPV